MLKDAHCVSTLSAMHAYQLPQSNGKTKHGKYMNEADAVGDHAPKEREAVIAGHLSISRRISVLKFPFREVCFLKRQLRECEDPKRTRI
jgi:hypothetical protein